jgi:tRNA uridine 5-carbamoylmethylation protein Kti12
VPAEAPVPLLVLVTGAPAAGKTTIARGLDAVAKLVRSELQAIYAP